MNSSAYNKEPRTTGDDEVQSANPRSTQWVLAEEDRRASVWLTTPDPLYRMTKRPDLYFEDQTESVLSADGLTVSFSQHEGQTIEGFGGTFTDAASELFKSLDEDLQDAILEAYFGETGIGYTLGKVPINSNDFSNETYSFDDAANDTDLEQFDHDVSHDVKSIIPMILEAQKKLADTEQEMHLLGVPWSPPGWMKTNGRMEGSKEPCLDGKMARVWARYISLWISAYIEKGVPVWAITPQNDPTADKEWEACRYSPEEEAEFIAKHLGPELSESHPNVKILAFDGDAELMMNWTNATLKHSASAKYVSGIAFHWFSGDSFGLIGDVHRQLPDAILLSSLAGYAMPQHWEGFQPQDAFFASGDWQHGQGYAHDIIGDLNAGAHGWIDGSLILNSTGGPNRAGNLMDAPIMISGANLSRTVADLSIRSIIL
ncbi:unnamed protein product [Prorocentrum cordatum]|uniref:Glycosyl hydrolase family 30 TIM-barrel domain-containing protein n=1 Tax=Prorocentrum cordatum TaxID=2364126 RepID=A0ABN9TP58_9DINO|nr:unnamed protein product [Polarella glacialis]